MAQIPGRSLAARRGAFLLLGQLRKPAGGHFRIADANGVTLAYVYVRDERSTFDGLTEDEAQRIAVNIAKLPALLQEKPLPSDT